jgi:hypothetical protein
MTNSTLGVVVVVVIIEAAAAAISSNNTRPNLPNLRQAGRQAEREGE